LSGVWHGLFVVHPDFSAVILSCWCFGFAAMHLKTASAIAVLDFGYCATVGTVQAPNSLIWRNVYLLSNAVTFHTTTVFCLVHVYFTL